MAEGELRVRVAVADQDQVDAVANDLEAAGGRDVDVDSGGAGVIPVLAIAGLVSVWMAAAGFIAWLKVWVGNQGKPGLLIRVTDNDVDVQELKALPFGQVILVGKDASWNRYYDVDQNKMESMIKTLLGGVLPTGGTPTSEAEVTDEAAKDETKPVGGAKPDRAVAAGD